MQSNRFTVTVPLADSILFELIAEHFDMTRTALMTECLDIVAQSLFLGLDDSDKLSIGKSADELLAKGMKSIHEHFEYSGALKWGHAAIVATQTPEDSE